MATFIRVYTENVSNPHSLAVCFWKQYLSRPFYSLKAAKRPFVAYCICCDFVIPRIPGNLVWLGARYCHADGEDIWYDAGDKSNLFKRKEERKKKRHRLADHQIVLAQNQERPIIRPCNQEDIAKMSLAKVIRVLSLDFGNSRGEACTMQRSEFVGTFLTNYTNTVLTYLLLSLPPSPRNTHLTLWNEPHGTFVDAASTLCHVLTV